MPEIKTVTLFGSDASQIIVNKADTVKYKKLGFMTEKEFKAAAEYKAKAAEEKTNANAKDNKTDTENSKSETVNDATTTASAETDSKTDKTTKAG